MGPNLGKGSQYKEIGPENILLLIACLFTIIFLKVVFIRKESNQMEKNEFSEYPSPQNPIF